MTNDGDAVASECDDFHELRDIIASQPAHGQDEGSNYRISARTCVQWTKFIAVKTLACCDKVFRGLAAAELRNPKT